MTRNKQEQEKIKYEINKLIQISGNNLCCDCRSMRPQWASVTIGAFICIKCAGAHRKLGTHISKVKSITLDNWHEDWIETMKRHGNTNVNRLYAYLIPKHRRIHPNSDELQREQLIRDKYGSKLWFRRDTLRKRHTVVDADVNNVVEDNDLCDKIDTEMHSRVYSDRTCVDDNKSHRNRSTRRYRKENAAVMRKEKQLSIDTFENDDFEVNFEDNLGKHRSSHDKHNDSNDADFDLDQTFHKEAMNMASNFDSTLTISRKNNNINDSQPSQNTIFGLDNKFHHKDRGLENQITTTTKATRRGLSKSEIMALYKKYNTKSDKHQNGINKTIYK